MRSSGSALLSHLLFVAIMGKFAEESAAQHQPRRSHGHCCHGQLSSSTGNMHLEHLVRLMKSSASLSLCGFLLGPRWHDDILSLSETGCAFLTAFWSGLVRSCRHACFSVGGWCRCENAPGRSFPLGLFVLEASACIFSIF